MQQTASPQNFGITWPSVSLAFWQYSSLILPPPQFRNYSHSLPGGRCLEQKVVWGWRGAAVGCLHCGHEDVLENLCYSPGETTSPAHCSWGAAWSPHLSDALTPDPSCSSAGCGQSHHVAVAGMHASLTCFLFFFSSGRSFYGISLPSCACW